MAAKFPIIKLIVLAVLIFVALVMGNIVLNRQLLVNRERSRRGLKRQTKNASGAKTKENENPQGLGENRDDTASSSVGQHSKYTIRRTIPTDPYDIRLWNLFPAPEGGNFKTIGEAYWRQVLSFLREWKDAAVYPPDPSDHQTVATDWMVRNAADYRIGGNKTKGIRDSIPLYPRLALERAAEAGNPMAQHYLANAYSSGIWPVPSTGDSGEEASPFSSEDKAFFSSLVEDLKVSDEWLPTSGDLMTQIDKAYLLWHMAAVGGHIDSAITLADRLDSDTTSTSDNTCENSLPYYQAAADGIMDQLEVSRNSRAKIVPPMDRHTLARVHMHGGTSSQLDWHNKPDESKEALQYYHMKATTIPWYANNNDPKDPKRPSSNEGSIDVSAAVSLGHMYHHGIRGVEQNLTKSLEYYKIAANNGNRESAGHACIFHLWGIGTDQNAYRAMEFCYLGAPQGFESCAEIFLNLEKGKKKVNGKELENCDKEALNGLGLLHLLGIHGVLDVNIPLAEKYFNLAKQLGSVDAAYNLAMLWLGWKTHYKLTDDLKEQGTSAGGVENAKRAFPIPGQSTDSRDKFVLYKSTVANNAYYRGPIQQDVQSAVALLESAATLGHLQSQHRLGMILSQGLNHTTSVIQFNFVKRKCEKAKELFKAIIRNASPTRSARLKRGYKEYTAGNLEASLRNYMAAAETGSIVGQVNAAFLLERGICLGLNSVDCAKASVRLWKAAAEKGNVEACLRVGDFYYYGRLHGHKLHTGPFGWIQYLLLPEKYLPTLIREWSMELLRMAREYTQPDSIDSDLGSATCTPNDDVSCPNVARAETPKKQNFIVEMEEDLHTAAHYYQIAGEKHQSARANFNLGFMHQWGLGLKQDFPMAKRHYDLALNLNTREAELAVQIALSAMNLQEIVIRWKVVIEDWWYQRNVGKETSAVSGDIPDATSPEMSPSASEFNSAKPPSSENTQRKTREQIIMSHLFDQSSLIIVILVTILLVVQIMMYFIGRPQNPRDR